MSQISVVGAGAFGTGLAIALARGGACVHLIGRNARAAEKMQTKRENTHRLPGASFPEGLTVTAAHDSLPKAKAILLAVPMQQLSGVVSDMQDVLGGAPLVACCKGVDLSTLSGPIDVMERARGLGGHAVLTGPSFAADIAKGLPTALTLACQNENLAEQLQHLLATPVLRLYRTTDTIGAELGGALKNVVAIAAGVTIGAGLGDSARAALMTRGYAEMTRLALSLGARAETLAGLSGFGDLVLTATSEQSRNFRYGLALGQGADFPSDVTVEGATTARAVTKLAEEHKIDMPITATVAALVEGGVTIEGAVKALLTRPLKEE